MTAETLQNTNTTKTFKFSFPTCTNEEVLFKLEVPVQIPHDGSTRELVQRVINMFHIPVYLENDLNKKLAEFVSEETNNFHNERDQRLLQLLKSSEINVEGIVKNWEKLFKEDVKEFADPVGTSDEEVFAGAYQRLVHSPALHTILQVEGAYAQTVADTMRSRDEDIRKLTERQTEEMEDQMRVLNTLSTEEDINELAARQFEEQSVVSGRWGSQLDALRHAQRQHHRAWLMATLEKYHTTSELHTPSNSPLGTFSVEHALQARDPATSATAPPRLEESFTIHLGSQLKQTHNIRIVAADLMQLCVAEQQDNPTALSRRLQRSLGLYSSELSAVVLLCPSPPPRLAPESPPARLLAAARASTEHHFPDADTQLRELLERCKGPLEERNSQRVKDQAEGANGIGRCSFRVRGASSLQAGDVFVTRHSNLAEAHVAFHLVVDDSLRSGDITSRHPAILGLRNILKAACANDVTSVSFPLLLRHEHSEEMTAAWCLRRAELVLKCAKGFLVEAAGWGGAPLRTLHAALPPDTQPALFAQLANLLPTIFRLSNPVKVKHAHLT